LEIFFGESVQSYSSKTVQFSLALTETYIFDYESIFSPTYSDTAKRKIEELIEAINAKIGPCCEIQDDY
jgi:hypothetical protein